MAKKYTQEEIIDKLNKIHNGKYDYSKLVYTNFHSKVCIICPIHGEFWQELNSHIRGKGCQQCARELVASKEKLATEEFIDRAKKIQKQDYDYSKVKYINNHTEVCIICPVHGEFWQKPSNHLLGKGCPICGGGIRMTCEEFIQKAIKIHGEKYKYNKVIYVNSKTPVCITCPTHGDFWQTPDNHINARSSCPYCKASKLEETIRKQLNEQQLSFKQEYSDKWLKIGKTNYLSLDFYLPQYNCAIECQGIQHFQPIDFAGKGKEWAEELFKSNKHRDLRKKQLCYENGIKLIYFLEKKYKKYMNDDDIYFTDINELVKYIKGL